MRFCFLDVESFYSASHSLTKMDPVSYVLHPDTEILSLAYAFGHEPVRMITGENKIKTWCGSQDWSDVVVVAHNIMFDGPVMAWRFGVRPAMWLCTLAMSKMFCGKTVGGSLKKVSEDLKIGKKLDFEAVNTKGKHLSDLTPEELRLLEAYNIRDVELCRGIFLKLLPSVPLAELQLIDHTTRMMVEPALRVDTALLEQALEDEQRRRAEAVSKLADILEIDDQEVVSRLLQSNPQFAQLLRSLSVDPPTKISPTTGKETFAFAKTDEEFLALLEHSNPIVVAAAEARLGTKSSLLGTRIRKFLDVASATGGSMPIVLNYFGALNSGRYSGGGGFNQQNLSSVDPKRPKPSDALRACIRAPKGHKLVASDLSGIEMRVLHYMWNVPSTMEAYAGQVDADLYRIFGAKLYDCAPEEITTPQRKLAKAAMLGLQYGAGAKTFHRVAKLQGVVMSLEEIEGVVSQWREFYAPIVAGWRVCDQAIIAMSQEADMNLDSRGIVTVSKGRLNLPGGIFLQYPDLRKERDSEGKNSWVYGHGRNKQRMYGPKLVENITQAVARLFLTEALLKVIKRYRVVHHVHDELIALAKVADAEECLIFMDEVLRTPPRWFPDIVLYSEGSIGDSYSECK